MNVLIGQSGGPTAVINSSLAGAIKEAQNDSRVEKVFGMLNGIQGYVSGRVMDLTDMTEQDLRLLSTTPSMYLGSCRYRMPADLNDPIYPKIFSRLISDNIDAFLYIGGNDSMDTVDKLSAYAAKIGSDIRFMGVPKTIDDDLAETDHTPGYGSAAKFVAQQVRQMVADTETYYTDSILIVEIMGRSAGWLTAASVLARKFENDNPVMIYLPESDFDIDDMLERTREMLRVRHHVVICVSEGIHDASGQLVCEGIFTAQKDAFGHKQLSGCGQVLEKIVRQEIGVKVRSVELNVTQRAAACSLSATDVEEASRCGSEAVKAALNGQTACMITMQRTSSEPYAITYMPKPVSDISNAVKYVPNEWIIKGGSDVSSEFISYAAPLIEGEIYPPMEKGLPVFLYRDQSTDKK